MTLIAVFIVTYMHCFRTYLRFYCLRLLLVSASIACLLLVSASIAYLLLVSASIAYVCYWSGAEQWIPVSVSRPKD